MRRRLTWMLLLVAALPAVGLAILSGWTLRRATWAASGRSAEVVEEQARRTLRALVMEKAQRDDLFFQRAQADAVALAAYAGFLYRHPDLFPAPLQGGTPLVRTPLGHLVNEASTPVGVFVPRGASVTLALWQEVGLLSHLDPVLMSLHGRTPAVKRLWFISATRTVRIYPNLGLGHEGSPVGPDYDLTQDVFFRSAAPPQNPDRRPVWSPPYDDPAGQGVMVTAAVPVYTGDSTFRGVAGADVLIEDVIANVLETAAQGPGDQALLLGSRGRIIAAPPPLLAALGLAAPARGPGRVVEQGIRDVPDPAARSQLGRLSAVPSADLLPVELGRTRYLAAVAPLPSTGWRLVLLRPTEEVVAPARAAAAAVASLRDRYLGAIALGLTLLAAAIAVVVWRSGQAIARPVAGLVEGARRLGEGDLRHRLPEDFPDEFGLLAHEFNAMAGRLADLTENLEAEVRRRSAELVEEERQVAVLEERTRLAREIHDTLAQGLTGILVHLQAAEQVGTENPAALLHHIRRARDEARRSLAEARRSVWNLRPGLLEGRTLAAALAELARLAGADGAPGAPEADGMPEGGGRPRVAFRVEGEARALAPEVETALLRAVQEGLWNSIRHARASKVEVTLGYGIDAVEVRVEDDGIGIGAGQAPRRTEGGFGLRAMAERVSAVGGELSVGTRPGGGTLLRVRIPYPAAERGPAASLSATATGRKRGTMWHGPGTDPDPGGG